MRVPRECVAEEDSGLETVLGSREAGFLERAVSGGSVIEVAWIGGKILDHQEGSGGARIGTGAGMVRSATEQSSFLIG
jgi:hypothetical protein